MDENYANDNLNTTAEADGINAEATEPAPSGTVIPSIHSTHEDADKGKGTFYHSTNPVSEADIDEDEVENEKQRKRKKRNKIELILITVLLLLVIVIEIEFKHFGLI